MSQIRKILLVGLFLFVGTVGIRYFVSTPDASRLHESANTAPPFPSEQSNRKLTAGDTQSFPTVFPKPVDESSLTDAQRCDHFMRNLVDPEQPGFHLPAGNPCEKNHNYSSYAAAILKACEGIPPQQLTRFGVTTGVSRVRVDYCLSEMRENYARSHLAKFPVNMVQALTTNRDLIKLRSTILDLPASYARFDYEISISQRLAELNPQRREPLKEILNTLYKKQVNLDFLGTDSSAPLTDAEWTLAEQTLAQTQVKGFQDADSTELKLWVESRGFQPQLTESLAANLIRDPKTEAVGYYYLAYAASVSGDKTKAKSYLQRASELEPTNQRFDQASIHLEDAFRDYPLLINFYPKNTEMDYFDLKDLTVFGSLETP